MINCDENLVKYLYSKKIIQDHSMNSKIMKIIFKSMEKSKREVRDRKSFAVRENLRENHEILVSYDSKWKSNVK